MKNKLARLVFLTLLVGCTTVQPAQPTPMVDASTPTFLTKTTAFSATATELPATQTPTALPTATIDWPASLEIPKEEVPEECLTRDERLSETMFATYFNYWGYGGLSCRAFTYSLDRQFLAYVQITYNPERDTSQKPFGGLQETAKVLSAASGQIASVYSPTEVKENVMSLKWLDGNLLNVRTGSVASLVKDLMYDPQADLAVNVPPTPLPTPGSLAQSREAVFVEHLAWSPDSQSLAAVSCLETCQLQLLKATDLALIWQVKVSEAASGLYFSPDGKAIAGLALQGVFRSDVDGNPLEAEKTLIQWFDSRNGDLLARTEVSGTIVDFEYSPNGQTIAALARTSYENTLWLFEARSGVLLRKWDVNDLGAHILQFNPWADQIAVAGYALSMWDVSSGDQLWWCDPEGESCSQVSQAKVARPKAVFNQGGTGEFTIGSMLFSQEKPLLITSNVTERDTQAKLIVWNLELAQAQNSIELIIHPDDYYLDDFFSEHADYMLDPILDVTMRLDEKTSTVTLLKHYALYTWDFRATDTALSPQGLEFFDYYGGFPLEAALHPQGRLIALWKKNLFSLFDLNTGATADENFEKIAGDEATMLAVAFSPDGRWLVTASKSGSLRLWNMDDYHK